VAIDPAVSTGEDADETGIIVAGKDADGHGYVLADQSARYAPTEWARTAIALYRQHNADRLVAEVNNGGDMVEATIRMIDPNVSYSAVRASRGKIIRAEPVAALYEQRRIHHVGAFPTLEDQMCVFAPEFDRSSAGFSPDRVDALVWAFAELLVEPMASEGVLPVGEGKGRLTAAEAGPAARADLCDRQPGIRGAAGAPETAAPGTGRGRGRLRGQNRHFSPRFAA
jgi:phage terminase large subunit-like protein